MNAGVQVALGIIFLGARLAHTFCYACGLQPWRTICFTVGVRWCVASTCAHGAHRCAVLSRLGVVHAHPCGGVHFRGIQDPDHYPGVLGAGQSALCKKHGHVRKAREGVVSCRAFCCEAASCVGAPSQRLLANTHATSLATVLSASLRAQTASGHCGPDFRLRLARSSTAGLPLSAVATAVAAAHAVVAVPWARGAAAARAPVAALALAPADPARGAAAARFLDVARRFPVAALHTSYG